MNAPSDKPLQKVTMNFYREDVAFLVAKYGTGWTTEIREMIHNYITRRITAEEARILDEDNNGF